MDMRRKNWRSYIDASEEKPQLSWALIKRVMTYARPYRWLIVGSLISILLYTGVANADEPIEVLRIVHSYDPCLACAVH